MQVGRCVTGDKCWYVYTHNILPSIVDEIEEEVEEVGSSLSVEIVIEMGRLEGRFASQIERLEGSDVEPFEELFEELFESEIEAVLDFETQQIEVRFRRSLGECQLQL